MPDNFGDRMKGYEKHETERFLPLLPIYARLDGKGFSKFTKGMQRPFDERMTRCMVETTKFLVEQTNATIGYTQSDEISLVWYSASVDSQVFFDGKKQKIVSVLASMATAKFNDMILEHIPEKSDTFALFDCRAFTLPNLVEATNALLWREQDATKNAVSMAARSFYSHKELMNQGRADMQEMMFQKGQNFNDYPAYFKRGTFVRRETFEVHAFDVVPENGRNCRTCFSYNTPTGTMPCILCTKTMHDNQLINRQVDDRWYPKEQFVTRSRIVEMDMPKFSSVVNRVDVIFNGKDPETEGESGHPNTRKLSEYLDESELTHGPELAAARKRLKERNNERKN